MNDMTVTQHGVETLAPDPLTRLTPAQRAVFDKLEPATHRAPLLALTGEIGSGKSSVVAALATFPDVTVITPAQVYEVCGHVAADEWEDEVYALIREAFSNHRVVVFDDYASLGAMSGRATTRGGYFGSFVSRAIELEAQAEGKCLVLTGPTPSASHQVTDFYGYRSNVLTIAPLLPEDYAVIVANVVGAADTSAQIDFDTIHQFAPGLDGYQLRLAARLARHENKLTTDGLLAVLRDDVLYSNTRIDEVEALSFDSLPGIEDIVEQLETNVVLPFEHPELARKVDLRPKRGVLLYGPPGTGKTSIGRALAHRIKGKFFLIDGSFRSEPPGPFFNRVTNIVREAKENAPSILFIDDADVLFDIVHISGLSRYLLTLLDGLESEASSSVCVMMTAMNPSKLPDALLRSGRVELWLETRTPDEATRARILDRWMGDELPGRADIDFVRLAAAPAGFTAADLRRATGDAKSLYAADIIAGEPRVDADTYMVRAVNDIVDVRARVADLLGDETLRVGRRLSEAQPRTAA